MSENDTPKGPYTLWLNYGCYEGWKFSDHATLRDALEAEKHDYSWHISKPALYVVSDADSVSWVPMKFSQRNF